MSGHSKWSNIKRKKEAADTKKAKIFSKLGKEITVAVKFGGVDPSTNNKLKDVISKAKSENMPNENITRCIKKASGEKGDINYENIVYEGFGPFGVAVIVEAFTNNKNRTAADVRCIFDRAGGSLGQTGSVSYLFKSKGYFLIENNENIDFDEFMLNLIEVGADDILDEEEYFEVLTSVEKFNEVKKYLEDQKYTLIESEIKQVPDLYKDLTEDEMEKFQDFLDKLLENDDVESIWHDVEM